jgi:hypothetical protein
MKNIPLLDRQNTVGCSGISLKVVKASARLLENLL